MTLLLPTRLTFTIFTAHSIHAYIRLVKPIPSRATGRSLEGNDWVIYEEAGFVKSSSQAPESAGQLPRKRPLRHQMALDGVRHKET
jgi:hypothetical protein